MPIAVRRDARLAARAARRVPGAKQCDGRFATRHEVDVVHQHRAQVGGPQRDLDVVPAGVDVVIARNHVHAERGLESAERARVGRDVLGAIVDQVACDGDEIGGQRARGVDDATEEAAGGVRSDVKVRQLGDAQPVELGAQARHLGVDVADGETSRAEIAREEDNRRDCERGRGEDPASEERMTKRRARQQAQNPTRGDHW
jgi:hypothetical protein